MIVQYIGRSVGVDCDCNDLEKCDIIAAGVGRGYLFVNFLLGFTAEAPEIWNMSSFWWRVFLLG